MILPSPWLSPNWLLSQNTIYGTRMAKASDFPSSDCRAAIAGAVGLLQFPEAAARSVGRPGPSHPPRPEWPPVWVVSPEEQQGLDCQVEWKQLPGFGPSIPLVANRDL
jgi:hypothetical protein